MEFKIDPGLITVFGIVFSAIGALALYIKSLHKHHSQSQNENLIRQNTSLVAMTEAMIKNSSATQANTAVLTEMKILLHDMNIRQVKSESKKNGKHGDN